MSANAKTPTSNILSFRITRPPFCLPIIRHV
jgi:hypothetical protein